MVCQLSHDVAQAMHERPSGTANRPGEKACSPSSTPTPASVEKRISQPLELSKGGSANG